MRIPGASHSVRHDQPERVAVAIEEFLARIDWTSPKGRDLLQ
jgi:hypothetical protein